MPQIISDELGQSFQLKEKDQSVLKGKESFFTNVATVEAIASFVATSLGPTGMDKILIDQDDNLTVTNDGATILKEMVSPSNPVSQLIKQLSISQDDEIGDGTTTIVILASAMLKQAKALVERGMHPVRISEGFSTALRMASEHLKTISVPITDLRSFMVKAARTSLESKIASSANLAEKCADAILSTADIARKDVDLERIYIQTRSGRNISESSLVRGIVLKKEFSHPQMAKTKTGARIALLSCPFEPPKLKNKNSLLIKSAEEYRALEEYEKKTFRRMIEALKAVGAEVVLCQWGFDDEANSMLMEAGIMAVRWVGGHELGLLASHLGAKITARFESLTEDCLGIGNVKEMTLFTEEEKVIVVESSKTGASECVTMVIRGSSEYVIEEAKRSVWDALCAARNILTNDAVVYGGGSAELNTSIFLETISRSKNELTVEELECLRAFSRALLEIPAVLAGNSGYDAIAYVEKIRDQQISTGDFSLGVDCLGTGECNMKNVEVFEALNSKVRQLKMAVELVGMILKINDVVRVNEE